MIWLADVLRVICIPCACITVGISLRVSTSGQWRDVGQLLRFLALAVLNIALAFGDFSGLGHSPRSWTALSISTVGILLSLAGTVALWWETRRERRMKTAQQLVP